ncbi:MAG: DUF4126 family protein [Gemmatimonadota bacterium]|nr:MAG: DUF4126 family protein [Gemmatimonadota bacterium]
MEPTLNPESIALLLSLLATAVAMGLSLYTALGALGAAAYLGFIILPESPAGLAAPLVWGTLVALAVVELILSRFRLLDLIWSALHTLVRPPAAALFAAAALDQHGRYLGWAVALAALVVALLVHIPVLAVHTAARTAGPSPRRRGFTAVQLGLAAVIATLAWIAPPFAAAGALVMVLAPLPWWPRLWGAAYLALAGCFAVISRAGRYHRWDAGPDLPARLSKAAEAELDIPISRVRSARASLARVGARWPYLRGRLLVAQDRPPLFAHHRGYRSRFIRLPRASGRADHGALLETVQLDALTPYAVCVGPDAPPGPAILAALAGPKTEPVEPGGPGSA